MGTTTTYDKRARLQPILGTLLDDPLLSDVPSNAAVADIDTLISVELGSAMKLSISKMDHTSFGISVFTREYNVFAHSCARDVDGDLPRGRESGGGRDEEEGLTWILPNRFSDVAVLNTAPVRDLKIAVQKKVNGMEQAKMGHRHISWRHVWKSYCLCYLNHKLTDDAAILQDFGIRNNSQLRFIPCISSREAGKHSHAKKRRFFHGLGKQS